jgi:hypothetical protein
MTQEEFIKVLDKKRYSYEIEGDQIIVTHKERTGRVNLMDLTSLPPGVVFRNKENVFLHSLASLPPGVKFENGGKVVLASLTSLPPSVKFENGGGVLLNSLPSLPPGVKFENGGNVYLDSLENIPPGLVFRNKGDVGLASLIGKGGLSDWEGNIEGIDSKRLLNVMIKQGIFER